jgi:hypothetical protein
VQTALDFLVGSEWTEAEISVWRVLRGHEGRASAIKADTVAELAGLSVRNVQRAIHALIHARGKAVGSSMSEPMGYFVAVTAEERQAAAELHRTRGLAMLTTAARIMDIDRRELLRQLQTELDAA